MTAALPPFLALAPTVAQFYSACRSGSSTNLRKRYLEHMWSNHISVEPADRKPKPLPES
jgi:hypothetical protein